MKPRALPRLVVATLICGLSACNGRNAVDVATIPGGGSSAGSSSEQPAAAGAGGSSGAMAAPDAGMAGVVDGAGGAAGSSCSSDADCPLPPSAIPCVAVACSDGSCRVVNLQKGALIALHSPPDCRSDVCDGQGKVSEAYDPSQLPNTDDPCLMGVCANDGPQTLPRPAATPCLSSDGGTRCDGDGHCVQCLVSKDCPSGQACVEHQCAIVASCTDEQKDGSETDVDCGGPLCTPCADGSQCGSDQDCSSDTCKPLAKTCSPATCIDQSQDADESDLDCGGSCRGCIPGQKCVADSDCVSNECDVLRHVCGGVTCNDKVEDGDESDVDCGGAECGGCLLGQKCNSPFDCGAGTCQFNVIPHVCN